MEGYLGETTVDFKRSQIEWTQTWIEMYGGIDGDHHKTWLIDQVQRILYGTKVIAKKACWANGHTEYRFSLDEPSQEYLDWVKEYEQMDNDGSVQYEWDKGISP